MGLDDAGDAAVAPGVGAHPALLVLGHVAADTAEPSAPSHLGDRQRQAVDFPLLTVAVGCEVAEDGRARDVRGVVTGLGSRPRELTGWGELAAAGDLTDDLIDALAERAHAQCHPLENMIVDPDWRRAMVAVEVRRALVDLRAAARA